MPVLSEWVEEQPRHRIQNIASRGIKLPVDEIYWVLRHMGSVMSLRKLHRKIAVTYAILKDIEVGQEFNADILLPYANKYIRGQGADINVRTIGNLMICLALWGLIEKTDKTRNVFNYRRVV